MQTILEELYSGNIRPDSRIYSSDSPFVKAARLKKENMDKLMGMMNETQKELFEAYLDAESEIEGITRYDTFSKSLFSISSKVMI